MNTPAQRLLIENACLFTPNHPGLRGWLLVENGLIRALGFRDTPDFSSDASFNAMQGLGHREPGTIGAAMMLPQFACELIADNIHVHGPRKKSWWM